MVYRGHPNKRIYAMESTREWRPKKSSRGVLEFLRVSKLRDYARIKLSGIGITNISGKIAGSVMNLSSSAGIPTARVWAKPRNVRTILSQSVRGILAGISSGFRSLTPTQINAWNQAANPLNNNALRRNVFGDVKSMSGAQLFQRVNNYANFQGGSYTDPPAAVGTETTIAAVATADESAQTFTIDVTTFLAAATIPVGQSLRVYATPQISASRSFISKSSYRFIDEIPSPTSLTAVDIAAAYIALFGALIADQKIGIYLEFIAVGTNVFGKSGAFFVSTVVVA